MQKQYKLTQERLDAYKQELEHLKTVREKEVADQIKEARSFGDLSENSEYDEAKNEQGKLYSRIAELEAILGNVEIIDASSADKVNFGLQVTVEFVENGKTEIYTIVGAKEADPKHKRVSDESPFGKALMNKHVGEIVTIEAPTKSFQCKILEITAPPPKSADIER